MRAYQYEISVKIAILFLDYLRKTHSEQALQSIRGAGYLFDLFTIERKGIARAINDGFDMTRDYDGVVLCANDIIMPAGWLATMVDYVTPVTGMIGIHCVEGQGSPAIIHGRQVWETYAPFGNVLITRAAINEAGYFNEDYDPYGMQDSDYGYRLTKLGFKNYYIPGLTSNHIGHDVGQDSDYRKMKDEGLALCGDKWAYWTKRYEDEENYTIFMRDSI